MQLKPGKVVPPEDYAQSMAHAMELALQEHWPTVMGDRPLAFGDKFTKLLFVAIAQGVVRHLSEHPQAINFRVTVPDDSGTYAGEGQSVDTQGLLRRPY